MRAAFVILALLAARPTAAQEAAAPEPAQAATTIYAWADGRGVWHFVDSLDMVPAGYRSQAIANARQIGTAPPRSEPAPEVVREERRPAREKRREPEADPGPTPEQQIAGLEAKRERLLAEIARFEEGFAPEEGGADGSDVSLGGRLDHVERELDDIEQQLQKLRPRKR